MMEKTYSLFLCVLLILVLFLPSTAAGRALLQTAQTASEASSVYEVLTQYPSSDGPAGFGILVKHFLYDSCVLAEGEGGYHGGNGGSKMGVTGSHSSTAPSRTGVSSPSRTGVSSPSKRPRVPITYGALNRKKPAASCGSGKGYRTCIPRARGKAPVKCSAYVRNCK